MSLESDSSTRARASWRRIDTSKLDANATERHAQVHALVEDIQQRATVRDLGQVALQCLEIVRDLVREPAVQDVAISDAVHLGVVRVVREDGTILRDDLEQVCTASVGEFVQLYSRRVRPSQELCAPSSTHAPAPLHCSYKGIGVVRRNGFDDAQ